MPNPLRHLPSVHELLENPQLQRVVNRVNHNVVVDGARRVLDDVRQQVRGAAEQVPLPSPTEIATRVAEWVLKEESPLLRPVINGTGVLLHTGLGRAPLSENAITSLHSIAGGYSSLEVDLESGDRSLRTTFIEKLLCELTGAEAGLVVNNNAAATMLALASIASGKEVIVSRGHLIEIGGSYRLPEVMEMSGAKLKEVGTTNKTRRSDYENAIHDQTGALMRVHPSNFEIVGFTESVSTAQLADVARRHQLPLIDDIGSGAMIDFAEYGLQNEPVVADSIKAGADVVLFSGDKLVGGPQCGIAVGKRQTIEAMLRHPLMRALRVDKLTLAALYATLVVYRDRATAEQEIPLLAMLSTSLANLEHRATRLAEQVNALDGIQAAEAIESASMLGGGTIPAQEVASMALSIAPEKLSVDAMAKRLRLGKTALFGRVAKDRLLLDLRTIPPQHDVELVSLIEEAISSFKAEPSPID